MEKTAWWKKGIFVGMVMLYIGLCGVSVYGRRQIQKGISREVLRFHVLADSDSREDQALKLQVKDILVEKLNMLLRNCGSVEESISLVEEHLEEIQGWAEAAVQEAGGTDTVSARVCSTWFPEKTYGDCTFPEGEYRALQIRIGAAEGQNWWCLLFPGLCFADTVGGVVPEESKDKLREVLTDEEYEAVTGQGQIRFGFRWF